MLGWMWGRLVSTSALKLPAQDRAPSRLPLLLSLSTLLVLTYPYVAILHCDALAAATKTRMKRIIPIDKFTAQHAMGWRRRKQALLSTSPYVIATWWTPLR